MLRFGIRGTHPPGLPGTISPTGYRGPAAALAIGSGGQNTKIYIYSRINY